MLDIQTPGTCPLISSVLAPLSKPARPTSCSSQTPGSEPRFLPSFYLCVHHYQPSQLYFEKVSQRCLFLSLLTATSFVHTIIISYLDPHIGPQLVSLLPIFSSMIPSKYKTGPDTPRLKALQWYLVLRILSKPLITRWPYSRVVMTSQTLELDCLDLMLSSTSYQLDILENVA